jgi:hypothetical protein
MWIPLLRRDTIRLNVENLWDAEVEGARLAERAQIKPNVISKGI